MNLISTWWRKFYFFNICAKYYSKRQITPFMFKTAQLQYQFDYFQPCSFRNGYNYENTFILDITAIYCHLSVVRYSIQTHLNDGDSHRSEKHSVIPNASITLLMAPPLSYPRSHDFGWIISMVEASALCEVVCAR